MRKLLLLYRAYKLFNNKDGSSILYVIEPLLYELSRSVKDDRSNRQILASIHLIRSITERVAKYEARFPDSDTRHRARIGEWNALWKLLSKINYWVA